MSSNGTAYRTLVFFTKYRDQNIMIDNFLGDAKVQLRSITLVKAMAGKCAHSKVRNGVIYIVAIVK